MSHRAYLIGICGVSSIYILLFIGIQQHCPTESQFSTESYNTNVTINYVLNAQRQRIKIEMKKFEYPSKQKLSDLVLEKNGNPVRSIIISSWRSGSTFLGDILNSMPGNYYHYEPLLSLGVHRIRGPPNDKNAINKLINLLKCDYSKINKTDYLVLDYFTTDIQPILRNVKLWSQAKEYPEFCWNSTFLTLFCKLFPLQSMKTVRLQLSLADTLLLDESLNVRIILLVRDPRGTMQSRKHHLWCPGKPDCDYVPNLCMDLVSDYAAAEYLLKKYPSRFRTLRYEDLSLNPYEMTQEILQFYGLPFHPLVKEFLDTHTKLNIGDIDSTRRDSKSAPFHWIKDLTWTEIEEIELSCKSAMSLWGYRQVKNSYNLSPTFDPLIIPPPFT